ncbi:hypothetical protein ACO0LB_17980 [Undibacterium sp. SXout7W]|uniref:hypothetical protein n=1 Tax=Undibacterium sp. SXout7W TaxID=3413049 RepID=UPI003BF2D7DD
MNVIQFPGRNNEGTLRRQYTRSIYDSLKRLEAVGRYDKDTVLVMLGYLSGAIVAFHFSGDDVAASVTLKAAERLEENWQCFSDVTFGLIRELDPQLLEKEDHVPID